MSASSRDDQSQRLHSSGASEQGDYLYDDPGASEPEQGYVPEREFVLMPLFRRIGELLGIRRPDRQQYVYEPEPISRQVDAFEPARSSKQTAGTEELPPASAESTVESSSEAEPERVFTNVSEAPAAREGPAFEHAKPAEQPIAAFSEPETSPQTASLSEPLTSPELSPFSEPIAESQSQHAPSWDKPQVGAERIPELVSAASAPEPQPEVAHARTPEEIRELVAPLREAAAKITAAISQAAEWLHSKEEEILRRAELPSIGVNERRPNDAHSVAMNSDSAGLESSQSSSRHEAMWQQDERDVAPSTRPPVDGGVDQGPRWEPIEVPALQREVAWNDHQSEAAAVQSPRPQPTPAFRNSAAKSREPGPQLVRASASTPFWKRVNWAEEFTPKRVAVIGALAMALLLIAGITLARRPAAEMLPQQTRMAPQPGGVTLSTHPAAPRSNARRGTAPTPTQRSVAPAPGRRQRAATEDDGADVVTHYYHRPSQKPSPIKQTVAGVRHYSDMQ